MYRIVSLKFQGSEKTYDYLLVEKEAILNRQKNRKIIKGCSYGRSLYDAVEIVRVYKTAIIPPKVTRELQVLAGNTLMYGQYFTKPPTSVVIPAPIVEVKPKEPTIEVVPKPVEEPIPPVDTKITDDMQKSVDNRKQQCYNAYQDLINMLKQAETPEQRAAREAAFARCMDTMNKSFKKLNDLLK